MDRDGGKEECTGCGGRRYQPRVITIYDPCDKCGGSGKVVWIDNIVPKKCSPNGEFLQETTARNISVLISELRYEGMKMGWEFEINPRRIQNPCKEIRFSLDEAGELETQYIAERIGFFPDTPPGLGTQITERIMKSKEERGFPITTMKPIVKKRKEVE